jgi:hypothetical protein
MEQDLGQGSAQEPDLERETVPYWAPEQGLSSVPVPVSWLVQAQA